MLDDSLRVILPDHADVLAVRTGSKHAPLNAKILELVEGDLGDHSLDKNLTSPFVELLDHLEEVLIVGGGGHDHQGVGRLVGGDGDLSPFEG